MNCRAAYSVSGSRKDLGKGKGKDKNEQPFNHGGGNFQEYDLYFKLNFIANDSHS